MASYGSRVLYSQIEQVVLSVGGSIVELPTVMMVTKDDVRAITPENLPCIAEFPNQESFEKFLDSVRNIVAELERAYAVTATGCIGSFCQEYSKGQAVLSKLRESSRTTHEYLNSEYWKDQPHQQILSLMSKARDLTHIQASDEEDRLFQLVYVLSLLSLSIVRFATAVLFVPSSQKEEVAKLALLGGRTGYEERRALLQGFYDFMTREIQERFRAKYPVPRNQFIENVIPSYSKYLSDLTIRLCQSPRLAAFIPRVMDLLAYEKVLCNRTILAKDIVGQSSVSIDEISRITKDFSTFVQRSGLGSSYFDHTLDETLKDLETSVGWQSKDKAGEFSKLDGTIPKPSANSG